MTHKYNSWSKGNFVAYIQQFTSSSKVIQLTEEIFRNATEYFSKEVFKTATEKPPLYQRSMAICTRHDTKGQTRCFPEWIMGMWQYYKACCF